MKLVSLLGFVALVNAGIQCEQGPNWLKCVSEAAMNA